MMDRQLDLGNVSGAIAQTNRQERSKVVAEEVLPRLEVMGGKQTVGADQHPKARGRRMARRLTTCQKNETHRILLRMEKADERRGSI